MHKLPEPLAPSRDLSPRLPKRERTRRHLIAAAIDVFSARGVAAATMQEIAAAAGVTTGTVYNRFHTKGKLVAAVAVWLAETIRARSAPGRATLKLGAEQIVAGCRRYLGLAESSPAWAQVILDVAAVDPTFRKTISAFVLAELRRGIRQGEFVVASEAAALDLVIGATMEGMRRIALGRTRKGHAAAVVTTILQGLGLPAGRAHRVAARPLPLYSA